MNYKPILIVAGEPNSIFLEIFFKALKKKIKSPLVLIASQELLLSQMQKLKFSKKIKILDVKKIKNYSLNNKAINLIDVKYYQKKPFEKISKKSSVYINKSFLIAVELIKNGFTNKFINGPISKKTFLKKKKLGITEYISDMFTVKNNAMLIYNKKLSVCPLTTHVPIKLVAKKITQKLIMDKVKLIDNFINKN